MYREADLEPLNDNDQYRKHDACCASGKIGDEFLVNATTGGFQSAPTIASLTMAALSSPGVTAATRARQLLN